jgi:hypothetical protein
VQVQAVRVAMRVLRSTVWHAMIISSTVYKSSVGKKAAGGGGDNYVEQGCACMHIGI